MSDPIAVTIKQAADMVGVSDQIIRAAINRGEIAAKRIPPRYADKNAIPTAIRVDVSSLRDWFSSLTDARP